MKLKMTDDLAVGCESGTCLLIDSNGDKFAESGNTTFDDLGIEIPRGEYLVLKVLPETQDQRDGLQLGADLEILGCQFHIGNGEVQEYCFGNLPVEQGPSANIEEIHMNFPMSLGGKVVDMLPDEE